jgi:hypothetical protein
MNLSNFTTLGSHKSQHLYKYMVLKMVNIYIKLFFILNVISMPVLYYIYKRIR